MAEGQPDQFGKMIDDANVLRLIADCCNGTASEQQFAELSELIVESKQIREFYLAHTALHYQLMTHAPVPLDAAPSDAASSETGTVASSGSQSHRSRFSAALAVAASILLLLLGGYSLLNAPPEKSPVAESPDASVGYLKPDTKADSGRDLESRMIFPDRPYTLPEGSFDLALSNGVQVKIAAPARFTFHSAMQMRLYQGRLTANVPEAAIGFTVMTDQANIVDQGTEFGVAVEEGKLTDVAVFDGQVDVATSKKTLSLVLGKAISVAHSGNISRLGVVRPDTFEIPQETDYEPGAIIRSVSDNIRGDDALDYYKIVRRGFGEDQRAYVDRHHQWNGTSTDGLPEFLLGADYVMPFNSDKHSQTISITISLAASANLYVLFDTRLEPPRWLVDDFDNTGAIVGQDEVHPNRPAQRGPARSIDRLFAVWKSRSVVDGDVPLGSLIRVGQTSKDEQSMYGIAAVPAAETN